MSRSDDETKSTCTVAFVNGHELLTNCYSGLTRNVLLVSGYLRKIPVFIPIAISNLCFNFYFKDPPVNTLDMEFDSLFQSQSVGKNTMFKELVDQWSKRTGIPETYLEVYHYTKRKNETFRPNVRIQVDLEEKWTVKHIKSHSVEAKPTLNQIESIYNRIGDVTVSERSFLLLDGRRIKSVEVPKAESDAQTVLVALKYFDILDQKMYFVDWLRIKLKSFTFGDIAKYIESDLIPNTMANGGCAHSLHYLNEKMKSSRKPGVDESNKFVFYEEVASRSQSDCSDSSALVQEVNDEDAKSMNFFDGDIFVFQVNPYHPCFSELEMPGLHKFDDILSLMQPLIQLNQLADNQLSHHLRVRKAIWEMTGSYWYSGADEFIKSQANMVVVDLKIFGRMRFTNMVIDRRLHGGREMGDKIRKQHKWRVDERTTFGLIRARLARYYDIKIEHIAIHLPKSCSEDTEHPTFWPRDGRGYQVQPLSDVVQNMPTLRNGCPLGFHFVTYNVNDVERMILRHNGLSTGVHLLDLDDRIRDLALFNLRLFIPSHSTNASIQIAHEKDWTAKDLIQRILDMFIENFLFFYPILGHIPEYIRRFEMENQPPSSQSFKLIIRDLNASRFVIVGKNHNGIVREYHMEDKYSFPAGSSQIKFTHLNLRLLRKNDPLMLQDGSETTPHQS